jgi:hypothetical protein
MILQSASKINCLAASCGELTLVLWRIKFPIYSFEMASILQQYFSELEPSPHGEGLSKNLRIGEERIDTMESLTLDLSQLISSLLEKLGMGAVIPEGVIWALGIIASAIALFTLIVCLLIGHAKLMNLISGMKMKKSRGWMRNIKNSKRLSFEDQFDKLFGSV